MNDRYAGILRMHFLFGVAMLGACGTALAATDDLATLRQELKEQRAQLEQQREALRIQQQKLDEQLRELAAQRAKLDALSARVANGESKEASEEAPAAPAVALETEPVKRTNRDAVGDLNSGAIEAGTYTGMVRTKGKDISLAIGGFVRTVAISDSNAEATGADMLPSNFGTRREDRNGAFSLDSTLTRVYLDAESDTPGGRLRGYIENDFNDQNDGQMKYKLRHAYASWTNAVGTLTVGQTWSTFMDLKTLPPALTEPTMSGAVFTRQPIVRWSQPVTSRVTIHTALEDPNSSDIFSTESIQNQSNVPDVVLGIEYVVPDVGHLRLNGLARELRIATPTQGDEEEFGWGVSLTGSWTLLPSTRLTFGGVYGQAIGRYLLGIQPSDGAAIDPTNDALKARDNWGAFGTLRQSWTPSLTSALIFGYAKADPFSFTSGDALRDTTYAAGNLIWSIFPYLSMGIEYDYGRRENQDGSDIDNNRVMLGIQIF